MLKSRTPKDRYKRGKKEGEEKTEGEKRERRKGGNKTEDKDFYFIEYNENVCFKYLFVISVGIWVVVLIWLSIKQKSSGSEEITTKN